MAKVKKEKRDKRKTKTFWVVIGIGSLVVFLLILLNTVLGLGDKLSKVHPHLEWTFYGIMLILFWIFVIHPLRIIIFAPTISVKTVLERDSRKYRRAYRKVAKNLIKDDMIEEIDKEIIQSSLNQQEELENEISRVFNKSIKKELNKIIIRNAKTVMVSTAISQNGRLDMLMIMGSNLKMIKELVLKCGFRPSYPNLGKLSLNVLATALIAEGIENLDIEDILPSTAMSFISEVPFLKPITSSILQGITNALLTVRIGIVTRKYLFADTKIVSKNQIRIEALKESIKMLPIVIKESLGVFPTRIGKMIKKPKEDPAN